MEVRRKRGRPSNASLAAEAAAKAQAQAQTEAEAAAQPVFVPPVVSRLGGVRKPVVRETEDYVEGRDPAAKRASRASTGPSARVSRAPPVVLPVSQLIPSLAKY